MLFKSATPSDTVIATKLYRTTGTMESSIKPHSCHEPIEIVRAMIFAEGDLFGNVSIVERFRFWPRDVEIFLVIVPPGFNHASIVSHRGIFLHIFRRRISVPSLEAVNVADARARDKQHPAPAHPQLVRNFEIFAAPDFEAGIVVEDAFEVFTVDGKKSAGHGGRGKRLEGPSAVPRGYFEGSVCQYV